MSTRFNFCSDTASRAVADCFHSRMDSNIFFDRLLQGPVWATHAVALESCLLLAQSPNIDFAKRMGC